MNGVNGCMQSCIKPVSLALPYGEFSILTREIEGDLEKNAKLWYKEVDPNILGHYWGKRNASDPSAAAIDNMYRIMRVKAGKESTEAETIVRQTKWEELLCVMESLEKELGWAPQDGTEAYTSDRSASHQSMVLGESTFEMLVLMSR